MIRHDFFKNEFSGKAFLWNEKRSPVTFILCFIGVIIAVILVTIFSYPYDFDMESYFYIEMAKGHINNVIKPFSNRILHPFISGFVYEHTGITLSYAFISIQIIALFVFLKTIFLIQKKNIQNPLLIAIILFCPLLIAMFQQYYLADLFYSALLTLFFLCLILNKIWLSFILLLLLQTTRESTLLLILIISIVCIYHKNWKLLAGTIVFGIIGIVVTSFISGSGSTNIHSANTFMYLFAKIIYNFMKNVLGIVLWTNTLAANNPGLFPHLPVTIITVPDWLPSGAIRSIGIYEYNLICPLWTLLNLLTLFGALPVLIFTIILKYPKYIIKKTPVYFQIAVLYGLSAYLIGTSIGSSVDRLIGYGWPAFWIAAPFVLKTFFPQSHAFYIRFFLYHILLSWLPFILLNSYFGISIYSLSILIFLSIVLYFFVYSAIKKNMLTELPESIIT